LNYLQIKIPIYRQLLENLLHIGIFGLVEARGIEKAEVLLVIFAKLRKWLYFAVLYDFAFSSFKCFLAVFGTNKW